MSNAAPLLWGMHKYAIRLAQYWLPLLSKPPSRGVTDQAQLHTLPDATAGGAPVLSHTILRRLAGRSPFLGSALSAAAAVAGGTHH